MGYFNELLIANLRSTNVRRKVFLWIELYIKFKALQRADKSALNFKIKKFSWKGCWTDNKRAVQTTNDTNDDEWQQQMEV